MSKLKDAISKPLIFMLKKLDINLLPHAKVQNGLGCVDPETNGERSIFRYLSKVSDLKVVADVGANDGQYSLMLRKHFPNANIHAFEPMETTFELAKTVLANDPNIALNKLALGSTEGELILYNDASNHWDKVSTSYPDGLTTFFGMNNLQAYPVKLSSLDLYVADTAITGFDFIKIDVEGAELEVLKGAKDLIQNRKLEIIQFEFNNFNISSKTYLKTFMTFCPATDFSV